jgi:hypothetical protein
MPDAKRKEKKKKKSFFVRLAERGRDARNLGRTLKNEPRAFPGEVLRLIRRSIRTVWDARGGGLYACGFVVTFVFLEIRMFFVDIFEAESVGGFFAEQATEIFFRYLGESIQNTISAFLWPVYVIEIRPPWGIGALVAMYLVFPRFIKPSLERWLFDEEATVPPESLSDA